MPVDIIGLEVGYQLIPLVDKNQGGELLNRMEGVRKKLSQEFGFLVPAVHIRDNLDLAPNQYRITLMGVSTGEATVYHDKEMAINPGQVFGQIQASLPRIPRSGWRRSGSPRIRSPRPRPLGYTVVDAATVVATHLSQIPLQPCRPCCLGHDEVQQLLDMIGKHQSKLVEGLVPEVISMGNLVKVLQNLLNEGVPIRDMRTILQTLVEYAPRSPGPGSADRRLPYRPAQADRAGDRRPRARAAGDHPFTRTGTHICINPCKQVGEMAPVSNRDWRSGCSAPWWKPLERQELEGQPAVLLTSGILRNTLAKFVKNAIPGLRVLSYQEVPDDKQIRIVSAVRNRAS